LEVDDTLTVYDALTARASQPVYRDKASCLDWESQCNALKDTVSKAQVVYDGIEKWAMPLEFGAVWGNWCGLEAKVAAQLARLRRYFQSFDDFDQDDSRKTKESNSKFTDSRDASSKKMRDLGMSAALAKPAAEAIQSKILPQHGLAKPSVSMPPTDSATADYFALFSWPQFLGAVKDASDTNVWQVKAFEYYQKQRDAWESLAVKKISAAVEAAKNHWHGTVGAADEFAEFPWDCVPNSFAPAPKLKPLLHVVRAYSQDNRRAVNPLGMQRQAVQVISGDLVVIVTDAAFSREHSDKLDAFLKDAHHTALAPYPYFYLSPGDTLVIPVGSLALFVAVKITGDKIVVGKRGPKSKPAVDEYTAFVIHPAFDADMDARHPAETQRASYHALIASMNWTPATYTQNERVVQWKAKMQSADAGDAVEVASAPHA